MSAYMLGVPLYINYRICFKTGELCLHCELDHVKHIRHTLSDVEHAQTYQIGYAPLDPISHRRMMSLPAVAGNEGDTVTTSTTTTRTTTVATTMAILTAMLGSDETLAWFERTTLDAAGDAITFVHNGNRCRVFVGANVRHLYVEGAAHVVESFDVDG